MDTANTKSGHSFRNAATIVLVVLGVLSCESADTQLGHDNLSRSDSAGRLSRGTVSLLKDQITEIADVVARERGWFPEERRTFDEGNVLWRRCSEGMHVPELAGHDYQVVFYGRQGAVFDGDLAVVVDRNTGGVLKIIEW